MVAKADVFRYNMVGDRTKENFIIDKSIDFGARIVKLHRYLVKTKHEAVLSMQILRSGTSIGANDCLEIKRILISSINTAKENMK